MNRVVVYLLIKGDETQAVEAALARGFSTAFRRFFKALNQTRVEAVGDEMAVHRWYAEQPKRGPQGFPPGTLLYFQVGL